MRKILFLVLLSSTAASIHAALVALPVSSETVAFGGRWVDLETTPRAGWTGSYARFLFRGNELAVKIGESAKGGWGAVKVRVDGRTQADIPLSGGPEPVTLASGLDPDREYLVELISRKGPGFALKQVLGSPGSSIKKPSARTRLIEFCGDSITEGLAVVPMKVYDKEANPECYDDKALAGKDEQDAALAYGPLVAASFDADHIMIAKSGRGMSRNLKDREKNTHDAFPQIYPRWSLGADETPDGFSWQSATPPPVLVVIFLGANDVRANPRTPLDEFVETTRAFLARMREARPPTTRYLLVAKLKPDGRPDTSDYVRAVYEVERADGREDIEYVEVGTGDVAKLEPDWTHPNYLGQQVYARQIAEKITSWLGWPIAPRTIP